MVYRGSKERNDAIFSSGGRGEKRAYGGVVVAGAVGVVVVGEHGVAAYALAPHGRGRGRGGALLRLRRHRDASLSLSL